MLCIENYNVISEYYDILYIILVHTQRYLFTYMVINIIIRYNYLLAVVYMCISMILVYMCIQCMYIMCIYNVNITTHSENKPKLRGN